MGIMGKKGPKYPASRSISFDGPWKTSWENMLKPHTSMLAG